MKNKIDRLFQDKLSRHTITPSQDAWEQVKTGLDRKSKPKVWLAVAASVSILAMGAHLIFNSDENVEVQSAALIINDQPAPVALFNWDLPEIVFKEKAKKRFPKKLIKEQAVIKPMIAIADIPDEIKQYEESAIQELPIITLLPNTEAVATVNDVKSIIENPIATLPQLKVQITYKADESPSEVEEEKTKVGKLLARARQIKPGEMLASIRETKNDFFNGKKN